MGDNWQVYPDSKVSHEGSTYSMVKTSEGKRLVIRGNAAGFEGTRTGKLTHCPLTAANAAALRARLPWLTPRPLGLQTSAGCGDRLGLATPGHVQALRHVGGNIAPIFCQQSIRENARTGRSPQEVMDDAIWGQMQTGWRDPWGADADHLKTTADIDSCLAAGYSFFTVDPGDHVDNEAHGALLEALLPKIHALPWAALADSPAGLHERYLDRTFDLEWTAIRFDELTLARAAAKYGRAIAHTAAMYRHLAARCSAFDFEMSVDETETPTSAAEHVFVASELKRLGVRWVSLAPRYVGRFEKGVDYIGDLDEFQSELARHAAIARALGPYKLSIHSGSDKFSIYPLIARETGGLVHLKTAGTSYLEALRAIARVRPALMRTIAGYALERYPADRASYHVSAELARVPEIAQLPDGELPGLLDQFDTRQVLHVTFGSVLERYGAALKSTLADHEAAHYTALEQHFIRHLAPFGQANPGEEHTR